MTNPNSVVIAAVIDRSGSMNTIREATINGFNEFLAGQKALPGECKLHMVQFDHEYKIVYDMAPIASVPALTQETYVPRGNTALLDAVGRTINDVGSRLALMAEESRPSRVIFVIQTDGQENASREFLTRKQIFDMITHQRDIYSWDFIFLGANQDAITEGVSLGFAAGNSMTYTANLRGTASTYNSLNAVVTNSRVSGASVKSFTATDRVGAVAVDNSDNTNISVNPITTVTTSK